MCTALKLTRIKEIVGAIRDELQDWWEKAHFGQEQRDQFVEFKLKYDITGEVRKKILISKLDITPWLYVPMYDICMKF